MQNIHVLILAIWLYAIPGLVWSAETDFPVQIHRTGKFAGKDITAKDGEQWFGLFPVEDGFELKETTVSLIPFQDLCMGDTEAEKTGREVKVSHPVVPLILIRGVATLQDGPVKTVYITDTPTYQGTFLYPGQHLSMRGISPSSAESTSGVYDLGIKLLLPSVAESTPEFYYLTALGNVMDIHQSPGNVVIEDYRFLLTWHTARNRDHLKSQILRRYNRINLEGAPSIIWAGDLDGDDKVDLLMNIHDDYAAREYALFLSSYSEADELVHLVATFVVPSC
ncbi:MAG: hypothetical protein ACOX5R_06990 [bacterium]